jgi:abnormal spindle-like microcephaly-associated protein
MKKSVALIESRYAETLLSRQTRSEYLKKRHYTIFLQKWRRSQRETKNFRKLFLFQKKAAIVIQKNVRRWLAQRELGKRKAAVKIQSTFKMFLQKQRFSKLKNSIVTIESFYSAIRIRREDQKQYQILRYHAISIQKRYREKVAAVKQRLEYLQLLKCIKMIQTAWRSHKFRIQNQFATKIQATWKKYRCRKEFLAYRKSVLAIESFYKMRLLRRKFIRIRNTILSTQAYIRGKTLRAQIQLEAAKRKKIIDTWVSATTMGLSSIKIQRKVRSFLSKKRELCRHNAAIIIQTRWRGYKARLTYLKFKRSLMYLQAAFRRRIHRRNVAALIITKFLREASRQKNYLRQIRAATVIQAYWRGYNERKFTTQALEEMRERVRRANEAVQEHMKLGNRAAMALEILSNSSSLSSTLKACHHLDVTTSLSKNCCLRLTEYDVIPVIMDLIQSCNRSKPHMEILAHAINILFHLSKYNETSMLVYQDSRCFEILVEVLQNYREMTNIFLTAAKVIYLQLQYPERLQCFVSQRDIMRKFESIKSFVGKKMELDLKVKKIAPQKSKYYQMSKTLKQINYV